MAEAEDVIVDVARHATSFVRGLWHRRRNSRKESSVELPQTFHRLELVIAATLGISVQLRAAQAALPLPLVRRVFKRHERPVMTEAIPGTDGHNVWLPRPAAHADIAGSVRDLRLIALQQAVRAVRGSPGCLVSAATSLERSFYELLEAHAAEIDLARRLPAIASALEEFRQRAVRRRPDLENFPAVRMPLERWIRAFMADPSIGGPPSLTPAQSLRRAGELAREFCAGTASTSWATPGFFRDLWTGELRPASAGESSITPSSFFTDPNDGAKPPRSARLARTPQVRPADERDKPSPTSAWMIQTAQPHEHAEDPFGLQRPVDRDESIGAEEFAESVAELDQARLVATPHAPKEVLLSDDPPPSRVGRFASHAAATDDARSYPEWNWRTATYRDPGALVRSFIAPRGSREWVERSLATHRVMLWSIRRQFESLRAERTRLRQQPDGDELDIEACIDGWADARAGVVMPTGLYQCARKARRDLAALLLIDVSGSTDGWISNARRVIDVEREALLLVCIAMQSLGEPYSVLAFSGEGRGGVTVRCVKQFAENDPEEIALRIAGLEPERYTRAGAAIRHASCLLMQQQASRRLLLILSDGKPNDVDEYEGRYGLEDMRQAVVEARLQGIAPFCLTIDRQTASYLPAVFTEHQYAVLHRPELLPNALLGWMRQLIRA